MRLGTANADWIVFLNIYNIQVIKTRLMINWIVDVPFIRGASLFIIFTINIFHNTYILKNIIILFKG